MEQLRSDATKTKEMQLLSHQKQNIRLAKYPSDDLMTCIRYPAVVRSERRGREGGREGGKLRMRASERERMQEGR